MNPTPAKRARRSSSPDSPSSSLNRPARPRSTASPLQPILPPPIPSRPIAGPSFPTLGAGPSNWQSTWPPPRRSMEPRSPSSGGGSPRVEGIDEGSEAGGMAFSRDVTSRAPRSMMACTRCRRQKMKCDGPSQVPCRGCRQSGQRCIFEARSRPKSTSTIPSRPPHFFTGSLRARPGTPTGAPGFYPAGAQPAPPITSRNEPYALRNAREPMPPPPTTSISVLANHPPQPPRPHSPPPSSAPPHPYHEPPPLQLPTSASTSARPPTTSTDSRLGNLESAVHSLTNLPSAIASIQASLNNLQRSHDYLTAAVFGSARGGGSSRARETLVDVPEAVWENYRSRAWPLTPWLVGLREAQGLSGLVVGWLGRRTTPDSRREGEMAVVGVAAEVGRLVADRVEWMKEEIRALGVLATWSNDPTLACLAIGHARVSGLDRILSPRRTHDDWREWIYLTIMDQLCQLPDLQSPVTNDTLAAAWRDRLFTSAPGDLAVRDRDLKLLAWLEYAETLAEVHRAQQLRRTAAAMTETEAVGEEPMSERGEPASSRGGSGGGAEERERGAERRRAMEPWRKWASRWEAWAGGWAARNDLILSLHFNYAVLFTASPVFLGSASVWGIMAQAQNGYEQLERGRDAAFAVIQAIYSPEIGRTLPYSFALYRPLLALALTHLISLVTSLPNSPIISLTHVSTVLRSTYDTLMSAQPIDRGPASLLAEMVETGHVVGLGKREVLGIEPGRELWRRILG